MAFGPEVPVSAEAPAEDQTPLVTPPTTQPTYVEAVESLDETDATSEAPRVTAGSTSDWAA